MMDYDMSDAAGIGTILSGDRHIQLRYMTGSVLITIFTGQEEGVEFVVSQEAALALRDGLHVLLPGAVR